MANQPHEHEVVSREVFEDPVIQLAAICPLCALSALSPSAALAALSPVLQRFNPAINPNAAILAFISQQTLIEATRQRLSVLMQQPQQALLTPHARATARAHARLLPGMTRLAMRMAGLPGSR